MSTIEMLREAPSHKLKVWQDQLNEFNGSKTTSTRPAWKGYEKVLFRIAFIFFIIMSIPTTPDWYKNLFNIDWFHLHYRDLYDIARFQPSFGRATGQWLLGYGDWIVALAVATFGGAIWTLLDRKKTEYNNLYYWLRVIVRYRAGIGIIGFGFTKLFPVQMPYPSLGLLNTDFGDFTAQKIYWMSVGIVPWYQVFAGVVELTAGTLLFFRRTTTLGAALLFGALGDIVYVNFAYDGGVHVYSSYFVLFAAFLLAYDIPKVYNLLILEKVTIPVYHYPPFNKRWLRFTKIGLKSVTIFIFLIMLFYIQYVNFRYDPYKQPAMKGVASLRGFYNVSEFSLNNKVIPYSPLDTTRWQEVTFEDWSSLTYKVNKPVSLDLSNGGGSPMRDINRTFELTGVAGGKRVFYYDADTSNNILFLQDKNVASSRKNDRNKKPAASKQNVAKATFESWIPAASLANITDENIRIDKLALSTRRTKGIAQEIKDDPKRNKMILKYSTTDGSHVVLTGVNENKDSIYVVLERASKNYVLTPSSLQAGKY
jgi:hypothetical protein